jgi:predicted nucleotidyltransferase
MLSEFFKIKEKELLVAWLSDKLVYTVQDEACGLQALQVAESKVTYEKRPSRNKIAMIKMIADFFHSDGRVSKAWLFGSYARGEENAGSDVDLMISYSEQASGTLLDYADITYQLENLLDAKVDLVEEGYVKSFANMNINQDKILIYG